MKLAIAIILAFIGTLVIADQVGKVCSDGDTNLKKFWDGSACKDCPTTCDKCNNGGKGASCLSCPVNQYLKVDGDTGSCAKCADNCQSCRGPNAGDCIVPKDGYKSTGSALFKCANTIAGCQYCSADEKCGKCEFGYSALSATQTCTACSENCAECTSASECTKCQYWYGLNNKACTKCDQGCNECPCKTCKPGFFAATASGVTTCTVCDVANCQDCSAAKDSCKKCSPKAQLKEGKCIACSEATLCTDCSADATKCATCIAGYIANKDGKCVKCPDNCDKCSGDGTTCDTCQTAYFKTKDNKCSACPATCKDKKCTDGDGLCSACDDGFFMAEDKKSCTQCSGGCKSCKKADVCDTCFETTVKIKDGCVAPSAKCKVGEALSADEKCTPSTIDNCLYTAVASCVSCAKSYYIDGGKCTACPVGCEVCAKNGDYVKCTTTSQEYFIAQKSNGKKDLTGYAADLNAEVDYNGKSLKCMPNNLLTLPISAPTNTQCNTHETCTYPVKLADMKWQCMIDGKGKNAVKVAISVFAMAIAAVFAL